MYTLNLKLIIQKIVQWQVEFKKVHIRVLLS